MSRRTGIGAALVAGLVSVVAIMAFAARAPGSGPNDRSVNGTIWVANRGAHTIRGFDASSGTVLQTVPMAPSSQPGDLAFAKGKLYVAEEFAAPPSIAIVDAATGTILKRIATGPRPHHVHVSPGGTFVAYGVFGTNKVGVIDTATDTLLGEYEASANPAARSHAGVFGKGGRNLTVYVANDVTNELSAVNPRTGERLWTMTVPNAHELVVTENGRIAYVSCRAGNALRVVDLKLREILATIALGPLPDTLQLSDDETQLTVGLRGSPAQLAVVDTRTWAFDIVTIGGAGTIAGHQWTSANGRFTFAAFEGPGAGVAVIDHETGNAIVQVLDYPGRPHGVDLARP